MFAMENLLSRAAAELTIRLEVESTLKSLLQDVEHAHSLEQSLCAHNELHQCKEQLNALKVRYEDREAAWEADRREKERLGMLLMEEIVKLSAREVKGDKCKREMEIRLQQLENGKSVWLADKSSSGGFIQQQQQQQQSDSNTQNLVSDVNGDKEREDIKQHSPNQTTTIKEENDKTEPSSAKGDIGEKVVTSEDETSKYSNAKVTAPEDNNNNALPTTNSDGGDTIKEEGLEEEERFVPHKLDEATLMIMFAYLDPLDVMNFAQTNKALLSKVNVMFGMGSSDADQQQQTSTVVEDASAPAKDQQITEQPTPPPTNTQQLPATTTPAKKSSPKTSPKTSPKLLGIAGPSHKRQGSGTSAATTGTTGSSGTANPFSQVSSWFGSTGGATDSTTLVPATNNSVSSATESGSEIQLNAAMASSMASKLTPAELSIILRMREKLQKCEADANKWRREKEDAMANLASIEAVKEFLVTRVRDTERAVQTQKEDMRAVEKKSMEDQEVIVFMDEKVKQLEKTVEEIQSNEARTKQESIDIVKKNEKKSRVLSDMLRFEREQMAVNEKEWKAAKKVLVKEVKSCRSRIVALEAEVEGCRKQNSQLKNGLMALQSSPKGRRL